MIDVTHIVEILKDKPFLLYYLYNKYQTGDDLRLPKFINRRKVVLDLINLGLIEFITSIKKHLHFKDAKFTDLGNTVYIKLDSLGIFTIFDNISLISRDSFITQYESKLNILEDKIKYPQSVFYKIILKNIGDLNKWIRNGNVDYRVLEIVLVKKTEEFEILKVLFEFKCEFCAKNMSYLKDLTFYFDNDDNLYFQIKCNNCELTHWICKKFQCFYFI